MKTKLLRYKQKFLSLVIFLSTASFLFFNQAFAENVKWDYSQMAQIPVLDQGRVKPLDTFSRAYLKTLSGKDTVAGMSAIEWLTELLFDQAKAYKREIFNIPNPQVVDALELEKRERHRYSYNEVSQAMMGHFMKWHSLFVKPKEELTLEQQQLVTLFNKTQVYVDIGRSFSIVFPDFEIPPGTMSELLGVEPRTKLTYLQVRRNDTEIQQISSVLRDKAQVDPQALSEQENQMASFIKKFDEYSADKNTNTLKIIPSPWENQKEKWFSPWGITEEGYGSPQSANLLKLWTQLILAYRYGDLTQWKTLASQIRIATWQIADSNSSGQLLFLEWIFNQYQPFAKSFVLYLTGFLMILASYLFWTRILKAGAFLLVILGFGIHTTGVLTRMIIMHRPPVTSLYESILFVSFIGVLFGIVLEFRRRNSLGIIIAALIGAFLHFLGLRYDTDGDTMGMLVAVLNTNFWLATHVVTITIGYGCCLVGGIMAHVYLLERLFKPEDKTKTAELYSNLRGVGIVALFFAVLGTILGGIWADQSWGRFWGWDPKENGALLIVLWLAWLIHGRISGQIGELGFVTGMVCTNVVVSLAWFGVNLLSVGLHSYGFTQNAVFNLFLFCFSEIAFALTCYGIIKFRMLKMGIKA
jgi:ABC-type transport system involved in cytochrome c biogenesis permease subunit